MVRLAIVGTAARAVRHQAALERLNGVEIAAVVDPASDDGVAEVLARSDIDAIVLALPSCAAAGTTIAAARAGKRLIAEYAPGRTREAVSHVAQTVGEHGASLELLFPERHQPLPRELKATLDAGKLGRLRYVHSAWIGHDRTNEPATQSGSADDAAVDFVMDDAAPALDMVAWLFGDVPVATVFARTCSLADDGVPRYVSAVLSFADASQAIIEIGSHRGLPDGAGLQRLALTGMRGSAYFHERDHDLLIGRSGVRPLADDPVKGLAAAYTALFTAGATSDASDAGLAIAAAESLRTGQPVAVEQ